MLKASDPVAGGDSTHGCGPLMEEGGGASKPTRQRVFEYVRARGSASRAEITEALEISAGSATTFVSDLIGAGHLRETESGERDSGRGRPRVGLEVVAEAACTIGIRVSYKKHTAVLSDMAGRVLGSAEIPSSPLRRSPATLLDEIADLMQRLLGETGKTLPDISAVGLGLPGLVRPSLGRVEWSSLLDTPQFDLGTAFRDRFDVPLVLDNDVNMLALAELWFGVGRARRDFAVITIENGVGMGLVLNNSIYRGVQNRGMELGHTKVQLDGALCRCGQRGCLEAYVADYALAREAATALDSAEGPLRDPGYLLDTLFREAKAGNQAAQTIFRRAGRYLSLGLANVVQLFDPELIVLSGERMQYDYLYADSVITEMQALTLSQNGTPCHVAIHAWGDMVWARGGCALALSALTDQLIGGEAA